MFVINVLMNFKLKYSAKNWATEEPMRKVVSRVPVPLLNDAGSLPADRIRGPSALSQPIPGWTACVAETLTRLIYQ